MESLSRSTERSGVSSDLQGLGVGQQEATKVCDNAVKWMSDYSWHSTDLPEHTLITLIVTIQRLLSPAEELLSNPRYFTALFSNPDFPMKGWTQESIISYKLLISA
ncbi:hypothetical protein E2P81_ATG07994 [Venturia nashicola]|nr:hypothetical protein E2P81_ATG07994 [Venturia nashicola]